MTDGVNQVILQGELSWPELKYTSNNKALYKAKVRIPSVDERTKEETNTYLRIVAWEQVAEYLNSLPPRSRVRVGGRIQERSFENREGQKQQVTDIVVDGVEVAEGTEGENFFMLQGSLVWPEFKQVGERRTPLFKGKVKIPYTREDGSTGNSYVKITAWDNIAEGLSQAGEGTVVKVSGHIQDRTWKPQEGPKRTFTDAVVTNFVLQGKAAY